MIRDGSEVGVNGSEELRRLVPESLAFVFSKVLGRMWCVNRVHSANYYCHHPSSLQNRPPPNQKDDSIMCSSCCAVLYPGLVSLSVMMKADILLLVPSIVTGHRNLLQVDFSPALLSSPRPSVSGCARAPSLVALLSTRRVC